VTSRPPLGYVLQIWTAANPQGFAFRQYGTSSRRLSDFEGLALVTCVAKNAKKGKRPSQNPADFG
jgi:hypothetical protein